MLPSPMKKTLNNTGATAKSEIDYFQIARNSKPIKSYGIKEFRIKIEAERKKKAQKSSNNA
jgi:hypothetical protein